MRGFEGGQMPLQRRLPKFGFVNIFKKKYAEVNLRDLERFEAGSVVDLDVLMEHGMIKSGCDGVKLLGQGPLTKALTIQVNRYSKTAKEKVEALGGKVEVI